MRKWQRCIVRVTLFEKKFFLMQKSCRENILFRSICAFEKFHIQKNFIYAYTEIIYWFRHRIFSIKIKLHLNINMASWWSDILKCIFPHKLRSFSYDFIVSLITLKLLWNSHSRLCCNPIRKLYYRKISS